MFSRDIKVFYAFEILIKSLNILRFPGNISASAVDLTKGEITEGGRSVVSATISYLPGYGEFSGP